MSDQQRLGTGGGGDLWQLLRGLLIAFVSVGMLLGSFLLSQLDTANPPPSPTQAIARMLTATSRPPSPSPTALSTALPPSPSPTTAATETSVPATPTPSASPTQPPTPVPSCSKPPGWIVYTVQRGDTLTRLALRADTTAQALAQANCLRTSAIRSGQQIYLPPTFDVSPTPRSHRCAPPSDWDTYRVRPGDTLYSVSRRFNVDVEAVRRANCLDGYAIDAGQILYVPPPSPTTVTPTQTPTSAATVTPLPTAPPPQPAPAGGSIELRVLFPPSWPWNEIHWQELWTVVQWQDDGGNWHGVEGWQGRLDDIVVDASGGAVGKQAWWVFNRAAGEGAFRWTIYRSKKGRLLATSRTFSLPDVDGGTVTITVEISP